jgi:branched-chain amino acid transport system substrate-binding protein
MSVGEASWTREQRPRRRSTAALLAAAAIVAVVLSACGGSSSSSTTSSSSGSSSAASSSSKSGNFTILYIGDLTGPTKLFGEQDWRGLQASAAYWNARGGIAGHKIVLTSMSDNGDATTAVSDLLQYVSSHPKPDWVYGGSESDELEALIPVLKRENLMAGGLNDGTLECGSNAATNCPTAFWLGSTEAVETQAVANYMKAHGYKKVGLLEQVLAYTESEGASLQKALTADGISSTVATFPSTQVSLTPEVAKLKGQGADVLFVAALGAPAGYAADARADLNYNVPIVYDLASSSADLTKLIKASELHNTTEEIFRSNNASLNLPGAAAFQAALKPYGGVPADGALDTLAFAWDDLVALHDAGQQAGSDSPSALEAAENNLNSAGQSDPLYLLDPHVKWTPSDHDNSAGTPADFYIVPVGPVVNGQVGSAS